jgi:hypothetical protein
LCAEGNHGGGSGCHTNTNEKRGKDSSYAVTTFGKVTTNVVPLPRML